MSRTTHSRYSMVSRRALLRAGFGAGAIALIPGLACADGDANVFAGALTDPPTTSTPTMLPTLEPTPPPLSGQTDKSGDMLDTPPPEPTAEAPPSFDPSPTLEPVPSPTAAQSNQAVIGELVVSFTYTQGAGGKNERPYVAVWVEDAQGELEATIALWYQQQRRGERWLDHLTRWYAVDADHVQAAGATNTATISSATRTPGSYAVAWDGMSGETPAPAGDYFVCVEAVREDGPYSLIREPFRLEGSLPITPLPSEGELSDATVQINV